MSDLLAALRRAGVGDVDDSGLARAMYSSDASLYRVPPAVVVRPRHVDELDAVLGVARDSGTPLTMRGAGTSIAGNAIGPGIVVDTLRHLNRVVDVDAEARTATVEPGVVHARLQARLTGTGLRFGPDPATHTRCTVGGMVGNNACGSRALAFGRTADNVVALDTTAPSDAGARLAALVDANLAVIRTEFGRFRRQVSGYSLEHLLPERGRCLDRFLVGSEGTLAVVRRATVRLVADPAHRALVVLGYPSMADAADAVPALLRHDLVTCEGMDERIVRTVRPTPELPAGAGWIFAEVTGASAAEAVAKAGAVLREGTGRVVSDLAEQAALWRVREDGAGLAARAGERTGQSGWEDAAVPPDRLGGYLRDFEELLAQYGYAGAPYGHFGDGCLHVRIDFELDSDRGRAGFRCFVEDAARLTVAHGGSLSGEHGDGRARSALLPTMYSTAALDLFAAVKAVFDPEDVLNPGVLVTPRPFDDDLRLALPRAAAGRGLGRNVALLADDLQRCTGVGKCLADTTAAGGVMCPSYLATREEKDSTRGRARVLQEMLNGQIVRGWDAPEVGAALDLCLACRGCARDCPTGVDMASYKAEWLHQRYDRRPRPLIHYTLGRLPALLRRVPPSLLRVGLAMQPVATRLAGVDRRRSLPRPARRRAQTVPAERPDVVVWLDTFTDRFGPQVAVAAREVLESAGERVAVVGGDECCGLTWLASGQRRAGLARLTRLLDALDGYGDVPVVVLEPSCLTVLRVDAPRHLGRMVAARTLAEHLTAIGWEPPDLAGLEVVAQPHCHHASVLGWEADHALLDRAGAVLTRLGGCCGMAGSFGMERGHYDVSVAVAKHDLLPAVRAATASAVVLADGFSCRYQLADLAGVRALHLAELLASRNHFDRRLGDR